MPTSPLYLYCGHWGEARVPTLDGAIRLKIPPRTQADRVFRAKGMPHLEKPAERGDLYARVRLVLPEPLSDDELETPRQLVQARRGASLKG